MKENTDIDQNELQKPRLDLNFRRGTTWKVEIPECFTSRIRPKNSRVPLETGLIYLFIFTFIAVFVIK